MPVTLRALARRRSVRFLIAGGLNTGFGFLVYAGLVVAALPTWVALLVGTAVGIAFNFLTTGGFVFRDLSASRVPKFVVGYLVVYLVNLQFIEWIAPWTGGPVSAQALLLVPVALFSYLVMSRLVFGT